MKHPLIAILMIAAGILCAVTLFLGTRSTIDNMSLAFRISCYIPIVLIGISPIALVIRFRKE